MYSTGLTNTEIFKYATLLYNNYKNGKLKKLALLFRWNYFYTNDTKIY